MRTQRETEEKERVLAEQVARATLEQIKHKFELDMACLQSRLPTAESQAKEAALDSKYLAQRQATLVLIMAFMFGLTQIHVFLVFSEPRKGQKYTKDYTAKCLCFQSANRQIHVFLLFSEPEERAEAHERLHGETLQSVCASRVQIVVPSHVPRDCAVHRPRSSRT